MKLTTTIEVNDRDVWMAVLGSAGEQYSWWGRLTYAPGTDWDIPGTAYIEYLDEEGEAEGRAEITLESIRRAVESRPDRTFWGTRLTDFENYDAAVADVVLQLIAFGEVRYA